MDQYRADVVLDHEAYINGVNNEFVEMDIIFDTIGGRSFDRSMKAVRAHGCYVSIGNESVPKSSYHSNLSFVGNHKVRHDLENIRYLMDLVGKRNAIVFPPIQTFDFTVKGVVDMMNKLKLRTTVEKLVLRVSRYAMFVEINLKIPSDFLKKVKHYLDQYLTATKKDNACVQCFSLRSDISTDVLEDRILVELWRNETSLNEHKSSECYRTFVNRMSSLGCFNYAHFARDLRDVLVSCPKIPSQTELDTNSNMFHVIAEFDIAPGCKNTFYNLFMEYSTATSQRENFALSAVTQVVSGAPDGKTFFILFHSSYTAQAWTDLSNTEYVQNWLKKVYKVSNLHPRRGTSTLNNEISSTNTLIRSALGVFHADSIQSFFRISYNEHCNDNSCLRMARPDLPKTVISGCALIQVVAAAGNNYDVQVRIFLK